MQYYKYDYVLKVQNLKLYYMIIKHNITLACILALLLVSCLDNDKYPELYPTMGTVSSLDNYSICSDSYGKLIPDNPDLISKNNADSIGQRVLLNINFPKENSGQENEGKSVTIYDLYKVLTKNANDLRLSGAEPIESFGNDEIQITSAYISKEHLNIEFNINGEDETIPHRITLLLTENTHINDEGLIEVELRHNRNSDYGNKLYWGVVSFTLASIPECQNENFKGFKVIFYNSESIKDEIDVIKQESDQATVSRCMKATQEIGNWHSLFTCQLQ